MAVGSELNTSGRYDRIAVGFHWLSAALIALAYVAIEMKSPHTAWMSIHVWAGSVLWLVSVLRLVWRLCHRAPPPSPGPAIFTQLSRVVHGALYVFVLTQPLLGMLSYSLNGKPVPLVGFPWAIYLSAPAPHLAHSVKNIHEIIGNVFYGVIGVHACAALFHHFLLRDGTMRRMSFGSPKLTARGSPVPRKSGLDC